VIFELTALFPDLIRMALRRVSRACARLASGSSLRSPTSSSPGRPVIFSSCEFCRPKLFEITLLLVSFPAILTQFIGKLIRLATAHKSTSHSLSLPRSCPSASARLFPRAFFSPPTTRFPFLGTPLKRPQHRQSNRWSPLYFAPIASIGFKPHTPSFPGLSYWCTADRARHF